MMKLNVDGGMAKVQRIDACCCEDLPRQNGRYAGSTACIFEDQTDPAMLEARAKTLS